MKRVLILATALLALVITIVACGGDTEVTREVPVTQEVEVTRVVEVTPTVAVVSPQQVVDAYVQALNAGDVEALAALWAKEGTFTFGPFPDGSSETENGLASDIRDLAANPNSL